MSKPSQLQKSLYHDDREEGRELEIQYYDHQMFISISWPAGKGGIRAESFMLTAFEARCLAENILGRIPDPGILEDNLAAI